MKKKSFSLNSLNKTIVLQTIIGCFHSVNNTLSFQDKDNII